MIQFQTGSGRVLDRSSGDGFKNGAKLQFWSPNGKESQQWRPKRDSNELFYLVQKIGGSELFVDVKGGENVVAGSETQLYSHTGDADQKWRIFHYDGTAAGQTF